MRAGHSVVFGMQVLASATGLLVGAGMLLTGREPAVYLPIVTSIIGYWLPAPTPPPPRPEPASTAVSCVASTPGTTHTDAGTDKPPEKK